MTQTILTTLALCFSLVAMPVLAQVNMDEDLVSFARWKWGDGEQSQDPLYTLTQTGGFACKNFQIGQTTKTLSLETQLSSRNCQCERMWW